MPPEFCRAWGSKSAHLFLIYLASRGFTARQIDRLIEDYDLRFAMRGDYTYRIVIPVRDEAGALFTWTARSIADDAKPKYKTLTRHSEKAGDGPLALGPITDTLLGYPALSEGGEILVIAEGPLDAMNLSLHASATGSRATCIFGKAVSAAQIDLLADLRHSYEKVFLLLDPDASIDSLAVSRSLTALGIKTWTTDGDCDPGEMSGSAIKQMLKEMRAS
jgi:hypothetical protein